MEFKVIGFLGVLNFELFSSLIMYNFQSEFQVDLPLFEKMFVYAVYENPHMETQAIYLAKFDGHNKLC